MARRPAIGPIAAALVVLAAGFVGPAAARAAESKPPAEGGEATGGDDDDDDEVIVVDEGDKASKPSDKDGGDDIIVVEEGDEPIEDPNEDEGSADLSRTMFTGRFETRAGLDLAWEGHAEDVFELRNRLSLRIEYEPDPTMRVAVGGRLTHRLTVEGPREPGDQRAETHRAWFEPELGDAYVLWRLDFGLDIAIGHRVFFWGRTDFTQPNNVLNPSDFRDGPPAISREAKLPVWSVELTQNFDKVAITLVWIPWFRPHAYDLFGSDWAVVKPPLGTPLPATMSTFIEATHPTRYDELNDLLEATEEPPGDGITGSELAARVTANVGGVDLGLQYVYQWDRVPVYTYDDARFQQAVDAALDDDPNAVALLRGSMQGHYERRHQAGIDFNATAGPFVFKGDVAFSPERTFYAKDGQALRLPALLYALQVDFMWRFIVDVSMELSHLAVFDVPAGTELALVDPNHVTLTGMVNLRLGVQFMLSISAMWGITKGDVIVAPRFTWRVSGLFSLETGVNIYLADAEAGSTAVGTLFDDADYVYLNSVLSF